MVSLSYPHATSGRPVQSCQSGLDPVIGKNPVILILGSFPGRRSLALGQYYAHPQNQFWKIMEAFFCIDRNLPYNKKIEILVRHRIALWDVIGACEREGSADHRIASPSFNPVGEFLKSRPGIGLAAFNGTAAGRYAERLGLPGSVCTVCLPSTSPLNTRLTLAEKTDRWAVILHYAKKRNKNTALPLQPELQENDMVDRVEPDQHGSGVPEDCYPRDLIWQGEP
jgi:hypoxanthine-DNA glycosylase